MTHYLLDELKTKMRSDDDIWDFLRESCLDGMWYWDLEAPEHEWMSPEFWKLFGYDPAQKEHSPSAWQELIHPEDLETAKENLAQHMADPDCPYDQIVRYRHADGHWVWVRCRGLAVRNAEGKAVRLLGAHTDMTNFVREAEHREDSMKTMTNRMMAVFDAVQSGIIGLDAERNVVTLNPPARHLLGGLSDETPFPWPESIRFLQTSDLKPLDESSDPINRALAGMPLRGEVHLMTRAADPSQARYVRVSSAQIIRPDADIQTVVVLDDVSEQERNRQQIERKSRLDALGQLTGGIAHDFNNLLATILYAIDLAQKEQQSERAERLLAGAVNSIQRGRQLTGRLLAFAKRQPGRPVAGRVSDLFEDFRQLVLAAIEEQIEIVFDVEGADLTVYCDLPQLENALLNLVLNSRDAIMRSGKGGRIKLSAREVSDLGSEGLPPPLDAALAHERAVKEYRYVEFSVTDDGPGMAEEVRRRSADPFFTTKDTNSGTGLGLSMVYGFAQQSDGFLQVYSELDVGTTVRLILPSGDTLGGRREPQDRAAAERGQGERILLVEDEVVLLAMMSETLEDLGYTVISATTGAAAWEKIEEGLAFDVLVSDIVMPGGVGGFELARRVTERAPDTPIILLSGYAGYTREERGDTEAILLQKPCMPEELARNLRKVLAQRPDRG